MDFLYSIGDTVWNNMDWYITFGIPCYAHQYGKYALNI